MSPASSVYGLASSAGMSQELSKRFEGSKPSLNFFTFLTDLTDYLADCKFVSFGDSSRPGMNNSRAFSIPFYST